MVTVDRTGRGAGEGGDGPSLPPRPPREPSGEDVVSVVVAAGRAPWGALALACLASDPRVRFVGAATCSQEALAVVRAMRPAVVVVDPGLSGDDTLALVPALREACPPARVLAVTEAAGEPGAGHLAVEVARRGGHGVIRADRLPGLLVKAVACLAAGQAWLTRKEEAEIVGALWELTEGPAPAVA